MFILSFRIDVDENNKPRFNLFLDLKKLYDNLSDDYVILMRLHYLLSKNLNLSDEFKDFIIDVSNYDDIADLYLISDMMITDYSSALKMKPHPTNCTNCGAVLKDYKCEYCGTEYPRY